MEKAVMLEDRKVYGVVGGVAIDDPTLDETGRFPVPVGYYPVEWLAEHMYDVGIGEDSENA